MKTPPKKIDATKALEKIRSLLATPMEPEQPKQQRKIRLLKRN